MVNDGASLTAVTEIVNVWAEVVIAAPPAVASSVNVTVKTAVPFRIGRRRKDELASGINRRLNREQPIVVVRYREAQRLGYFWIAIGN